MDDELRSDLRPGEWTLAIVLTGALLPWLVTITMLGIQCGDALDRNQGVCALVSKHSIFALLGAVEAPPVIGWVLARQLNDARWFKWCVAAAYAVNVVVAILSVLWASGDLGDLQ